MTGWRIGYSACPEMVSNACDKLQGQMSGANTVRKELLLWIRNRPEILLLMVESFEKRRNLGFELIKDIPGLKLIYQSGFYFFPDISYYLGKRLTVFSSIILMILPCFIRKKAHVASVGGVSFGDAKTVSDFLMQLLKKN